MKRGQILNLTVLLVCMLCAIEASAYDFEVDGIYYNKTSNNTVEVTYNVIDEYNGTYNGTVVIPSTVTYNGRNYTVTAIGERAFYNSGSDVTIPETVTLIKTGAFKHDYGYYQVKNVLTCKSLTPPEMEGAFDEWDYEDSYIFPYSLFNDYDVLDTFYDYFGPILFVPSEAYQAYKEVNDIYHYFTWIFGNSSGKTAAPSAKVDYTYSLDRLVRVVVTVSTNEDSKVFINGDCFGPSTGQPAGGVNIENDAVAIATDPYEGITADYSIRWVAVEEGKLPSDVNTDSGVLFPPYACDFDIEENGICYADDKIDWCSGYNCYDIGDGAIDGDYLVVSSGLYRESEGEYRYVDYSGDIVIPTKVRGYSVVGISDNFLDNEYIDFSKSTSLSFPFVVNFPYIYLGNCQRLKRLVMPISSEAWFEYSSDYNYEDVELESIYLFGNGDKRCSLLPVDTLFLGSGVTAVNALPGKVIYSYATTPPTVFDYDEAYDGLDFSAELHVPASALAAYFTAPYWCNFTNIIGDINPITDFSLSRDSIEMLKGSEYSFQPIVTPAHVDPGYILWQSTNTNVATVNNGVVTAVGTGECEIQAICQGIFVVCRVIVTEILPTEVTLSQESAKMEVGGQLTLTATVLPENATDQTINWSSSKSWVATVDNGVVTAVAPGECDIIASCGGKQARCHIVVVEHFIYISLDEHEASLLPNHILTLTPTVTPVSTELKVTSTNPSVAAARLAGNKIQVVGIREGEAMIVVQSVDGEAEPDTCRVTVYTELGDVDCDGYVSIADVTALIDLLLGNDNPSYSLENADCDQDGELGISDATILIDALLGSMTLPDKDVKVFTVNGVTFKMVKVKGGTFTMGATEEEDSDYQVFVGSPEHQVTLSDYYIGQTEVTQELWAAVMGSNPSYDTTNPLYPVNSVSWEDCASFISQLNALTGLQFRLPTEAEWEFAAQGGTKSRGYVYAGSNDLDEVAWFYDNSDNTCHPVATKLANELGLYDMNGNIEEWCNDWYSLYTEEAVVNPTGPETGVSRIHRGGRWSGGERFCRLTRRDGFRPNVIRNYMGLRLAL